MPFNELKYISQSFANDLILFIHRACNTEYDRSEQQHQHYTFRMVGFFSQFRNMLFIKWLIAIINESYLVWINEITNVCSGNIIAADPGSTSVCARAHSDSAADYAVAVWLGGVDMPIECERLHCVPISRVRLNVCPWCAV